MITAGLLAAAGVALLWWQPPSARRGFAPHTTLTLLLAASVAVWVGSVGLLATAVTGEHSGLLLACQTLWTRLASGAAGWDEITALAAWALLFPARGSYRFLRFSLDSLRLRPGNLRPRSGTQSRHGATAHIVPGLGTPAVTVGLLRPAILVDAGFWHAVDPAGLEAVLIHEHAHARGKHAWLDVATRALTEPFAPSGFARRVHHAVLRNLEALADDRVAHQLGPHDAGRTLGRLALGHAPSPGLGATGDSVWRVQRLLSSRWATRAPSLVMVPLVAGLAAGSVSVLADALGFAYAVGPHMCSWR